MTTRKDFLGKMLALGGAMSLLGTKAVSATPIEPQPLKRAFGGRATIIPVGSYVTCANVVWTEQYDPIADMSILKTKGVR